MLYDLADSSKLVLGLTDAVAGDRLLDVQLRVCAFSAAWPRLAQLTCLDGVRVSLRRPR